MVLKVVAIAVVRLAILLGIAQLPAIIPLLLLLEVEVASEAVTMAFKPIVRQLATSVGDPTIMLEIVRLKP